MTADHGGGEDSLAGAEGSLRRAEELLSRLEQTRERLETTDDPEVAIEVMGELAEIAKAVEVAIDDARRAAEAEGEEVANGPA